MINAQLDENNLFIKELLPHVRYFSYTWLHLQAFKKRYLKENNLKATVLDESKEKQTLENIPNDNHFTWASQLLVKLRKDICENDRNNFLECIRSQSYKSKCILSEPDKKGKIRRIDCLRQTDKVWRLDMVTMILFRGIPLENTDAERLERIKTCNNFLCINPYHITVAIKELDVFISQHLNCNDIENMDLNLEKGFYYNVAYSANQLQEAISCTIGDVENNLPSSKLSQSETLKRLSLDSSSIISNKRTRKDTEHSHTSVEQLQSLDYIISPPLKTDKISYIDEPLKDSQIVSSSLAINSSEEATNENIFIHKKSSLNKSHQGHENKGLSISTILTNLEAKNNYKLPAYINPFSNIPLDNSAQSLSTININIFENINPVNTSVCCNTRDLEITKVKDEINYIISNKINSKEGNILSLESNSNDGSEKVINDNLKLENTFSPLESSISFTARNIDSTIWKSRNEKSNLIDNRQFKKQQSMPVTRNEITDFLPSNKCLNIIENHSLDIVDENSLEMEFDNKDFGKIPVGMSVNDSIRERLFRFQPVGIKPKKLKSLTPTFINVTAPITTHLKSLPTYSGLYPLDVTDVERVSPEIEQLVHGPNFINTQDFESKENENSGRLTDFVTQICVENAPPENIGPGMLTILKMPSGHIHFVDAHSLYDIISTNADSNSSSEANSQTLELDKKKLDTINKQSHQLMFGYNNISPTTASPTPFVLAASPIVTPKSTPRCTPIPNRWSTTPFLIDGENEMFLMINMFTANTPDETLIQEGGNLEKFLHSMGNSDSIDCLSNNS